jgi:predicted ribosomally synthesized peptide with SipW-like signal peptide
MQRRNLVAAVVVLVGGAALAYWTSQADDPSALTGTLGVILAVAMGIALAAALLADPKHFGAGPRQSWFVVTFVVLLAAAAASFIGGMLAMGLAALLAVATTIALFVRSRSNSQRGRPRAAG